MQSSALEKTPRIQKTKPTQLKSTNNNKKQRNTLQPLSKQQQMRKLSTDEKIWIIFQPFTSLKSVAPSKQFFQVSAILDNIDQSHIC